MNEGLLYRLYGMRTEMHEKYMAERRRLNEKYGAEETEQYVEAKRTLDRFYEKKMDALFERIKALKEEAEVASYWRKA